MMMMIVFAYLFFSQIVFVSTNQLTETSSSNQSKVKQSRNRATVPQSLTLLMNFKDDGTTSFQIMQGNSI
jgi:hypothetical protein